MPQFESYGTYRKTKSYTRIILSVDFPLYGKIFIIFFIFKKNLYRIFTQLSETSQ